jgi:thiol:disulfide interchange protein DsbG
MLRAALILMSAMVLASTAASGAPAAGADRQRLFAGIERADAVREGAKEPKRVLYVFFDANCYYCHLTWKALEPYEKAGLQVRWVPVAYQKPTSLGRAAAIMRAGDRAAALRANESGYDAAQFDGGIAPLNDVPPKLSAQIEANTELMQAFGAPGTPALVWKDGTGAIRVKAGVPRLSELPRITGLPPQPNADPELERFR